MEKYNAFLAKAETYDIDHCFSWKYLVDVRVPCLFFLLSDAGT